MRKTKNMIKIYFQIYQLEQEQSLVVHVHKVYLTTVINKIKNHLHVKCNYYVYVP